MAKRKEYVLRRHRDAAIGTILHDLRRLPKNKDYIVRIERMEEPISDGQRKLFWKWMGMLDEWINGYKTPNGKREVYERYVVGDILEGRGISEITDVEMHEVMTYLQRHFAEHGFSLPSSMDDYYCMLDQEQQQRHAFEESKSS